MIRLHGNDDLVPLIAPLTDPKPHRSAKLNRKTVHPLVGKRDRELWQKVAGRRHCKLTREPPRAVEIWKVQKNPDQIALI